MTTALKVLGQSNPTANTLTSVYTVPAANTAVVSTVTLCNTGAANTLCSLAVRPGGEAIATKHYLAYKITVPSFDTVYLTLGIGLGAADVVSANVETSNIAVGVYGSEVY